MSAGPGKATTSNDNASDLGWETVWRALVPLERGDVSISPSRSRTHSTEFREGMTGVLARRSGAPLRASDLTHWLLPNLPWCGFEGELMALPSTGNEGLGLLRKLTARGHRAILFAFDGPITPNEEAQLANLRYERSAGSDLETLYPDPGIASQALLLSVQKTGCLLEKPGYLLEAGNEEDSDRIAGTPRIMGTPTVETIPYGELVGRYSHVLGFSKATGRRSRAAEVEAAIRHWTLFARACPSRLIRASVEDRPRRERAGAFWRALAGAGRTPGARRLHRLAELLEKASTSEEIQRGVDLLLELACPPLMLPPLVVEALRAPTNQILTDIERRELIYIARAGTPTLRTLAVARLRSEREFPDVRSTLAQLAFDADPWVREASREKGVRGY